MFKISIRMLLIHCSNATLFIPCPSTGIRRRLRRLHGAGHVGRLRRVYRRVYGDRFSEHALRLLQRRRGQHRVSTDYRVPRTDQKVNFKMLQVACLYFGCRDSRHLCCVIQASNNQGLAPGVLVWASTGYCVARRIS